MDRYTSYYYMTGSSKSPVREFIDSLDFKTQRKFFFVRDLLEEFGRTLPLPHAKYMGDGLFELRFRGSEGHVRVLYFFYEQDKIIFTNGFIKKRDKTPKNEMKIAMERMSGYLYENSGGG